MGVGGASAGGIDGLTLTCGLVRTAKRMRDNSSHDPAGLGERERSVQAGLVCVCVCVCVCSHAHTHAFQKHGVGSFDLTHAAHGAW